MPDSSKSVSNITQVIICAMLVWKEQLQQFEKGFIEYSKKAKQEIKGQNSKDHAVGGCMA